MSQYEELIQFILMISNDSEQKSYEILHSAEGIGKFIASFSNLVNGTNDMSAKVVCTSFTESQKELYKAAKALLVAAKAGYDWCGVSSPTLELKKVRR